MTAPDRAVPKQGDYVEILLHDDPHKRVPREYVGLEGCYPSRYLVTAGQATARIVHHDRRNQ